MPDLAHKALAHFVRKTGSCAICMRQSLTAAIVAWIVLALTFTWYPNTPLDVAMQLLAATLTALWFVHLATFASRALHKSRAMDEQAGRSAELQGPGRRTAIGLVLRAAAAGAAISLPITLRPTAASAFCGQCSKNSDCGVSPCRCTNTAGPGLPVCNECVCG